MAAVSNVFGPRVEAFHKAMEARQENPIALLSTVSTQSEYRQILPSVSEVDKFDSSVQDQHAQDQERLKQMRNNPAFQHR